MSDEIEFRVWVGCLACYNDGGLVGQWYDAADAAEVTPQQLHMAQGIGMTDNSYVIGQELYGPHEELWCFDIEAPHESLAREMSPMEATRLFEQIEAAKDALYNCPWQAFVAFAANVGEELTEDTASDAEDRYRGEFDTFRDYADEWADEMLGVPSTPCDGRVWDDAMRELGGVLEFAIRHFDYNSHARDMEQSFTVLDAPGGGVYVFSD